MEASPLYFRVPRNFEARKLFADVKGQSYANCLVDLVYRRWLREQGHDFVPLKAAYLLRLVPQLHYKRVRDGLQGAGVLDCDRRYVVERKCLGFRIGAEYRTRCVKVPCEDAALRRKLKKRRQGVGDEPVHCWLRGNLRRLRFDRQWARQIAWEMQPHVDSPLSLLEYRVVLEEIIKRFAEGDLRQGCDRYGRNHSPVTSLPKAMRACLSVDGQPLLNLDLANSQPLIAGLVVWLLHSGRTTIDELRRKRFDRKPQRVYRFFDERLSQAQPRHNGAREAGSGERPPGSIMINVLPQVPLVASVQAGAGAMTGTTPSDLLDYLKCCEQGRLYESFLEAGLSRAEVKTGLFRDVFFGRYPCGRLAGQFARRFPTVYRLLKELKRGQYRRCAWLMQNAESTLFIGRIARRIMRERPETPLVTVHDSALVPPEFVPYVEGVMREEFGRVGLRPTLHRESCAPAESG